MNDLVDGVPALTSWAQGEGELTVDGWDLSRAEVRAHVELRAGDTPGAIPLSGSLALSGRASRYDVNGRLVGSILDGEFDPGTYETVFDASNLPSSVFFYRMVAGDFVETKKLILLK